jgi:hypothetical protein
VQYVCDVSGEWRIRLVLASGSGWYSFNLTVQNQNDADSGSDAGDIYEEALQIEAGSTYHGFLMSGDSDDWFKFFASSWKIIQINLTLPVGQSVQLSIIDPLGNVRASSLYSGVADEYLACVANIDGNWSFKVHLLSWQANYTFSVVLLNQNDTGLDGDAGNTFEEATPIVEGVYFGQLQDADTKDYYVINCTANKWLNILANMYFPLDCDIKLFDSAGNPITTSSYSEGSDEYISYYVTSSSKFFISVELKAQFGFYSLNVTQSDESWLKNAEEAGDAGNTFYTATRINIGYYSGRTNSSDTSDWYKHYVESGQVIVVGASFPEITQIYIYAPDGAQKVYNLWKGSSTVSFVADSTGDWRISFYYGLTETYTFILSVKNQNDADVGYDAGNTHAMASSITKGIKIGYLYTADSDDWYKLYVLTGQVIVVGVSFPYPYETLDVSIYAPDATQKAYASYSGSWIISFVADSTGDWRISFHSYSISPRVYFFTLTIVDQCDAGINTDAGNAHASAVTINEGIYLGYLKPGDFEDWFKFNVSAGQLIVVGFTEIAGDINQIGIFDPYGNQKTWTYPGAASTLSFVADNSGDWRLRIYYGNPGTYSFILTIQSISEDIVPPTTTTDYDGLWHNSDFSINLFATDDLSGVAETFYRINNGPVQNVSFHGQPLITTESNNNTLEYWSVDNSGKEELPHNILTEIKLDKTPPIIETPTRTPGGDVQPYQPVKISVNATDTLSSLQNVTLVYSFDNGTTWETSEPMILNSTTNLYEAVIPGQPADTWVRFKIFACDYAENNVTIDGTEPYCVYQVIPEFSSNNLLAIFLSITLFVAIFSIKNRTQKPKCNQAKNYCNLVKFK